jgi:hypothetical protein
MIKFRLFIGDVLKLYKRYLYYPLPIFHWQQLSGLYSLRFHRANLVLFQSIVVPSCNQLFLCSPISAMSTRTCFVFFENCKLFRSHCNAWAHLLVEEKIKTAGITRIKTTRYKHNATRITTQLTTTGRQELALYGLLPRMTRR